MPTDLPDYTRLVTVNVDVPDVNIGPVKVAKYETAPADLTDGDKAYILCDIKGRPIVIVYGDVQVDHRKIKGSTLKDPTIPLAIPMSIENPAIAYDPALDLFKVAIYYNGTKIDPRIVRALTSSDVITAVQSTPANLKILAFGNTVKDGSGTSYALLLDANGRLYIRPLSSAVDSIAAVKSGTWNIDNLLNPHPITQTTPGNLRPRIYGNTVKDGSGTDYAILLDADGKVIVSPLASSSVVTVADVNKVTTTKQISASPAAAGNTAIWTPAADKKVRLKFISLECSADVDVGYRFTTTGTIYYLRITKGVYVANFIGCNDEGAADQVLYIYVSGACTIKGYVKGEEI